MQNSAHAMTRHEILFWCTPIADASVDAEAPKRRSCALRLSSGSFLHLAASWVSEIFLLKITETIEAALAS